MNRCPHYAEYKRLLFQGCGINTSIIDNSENEYTVEALSGGYDLNIFVEEDNLNEEDIYAPLPNCFRTIRRSINRSISQDYYFESIVLPYCSELVSDVLDTEMPKGLMMNVIEIIAEYMLQLKDDDLIVSVEGQCLDTNPITSFATGCVFRELCDNVKEFYGDEVMPLCIDLNIDSANMDSAHKRSLKPVKVRLKNVRNELRNSHENVFTVGYAPIHPLNADELRLKIHPDVQVLSEVNNVVRYLKR